MNADGSNARAFTYCDPPECLRDGSLAWSPDGERIAFVRVSGAGAIIPVSVMVWPVVGSGPKPEDVSLEGDVGVRPRVVTRRIRAHLRTFDVGRRELRVWMMDADGSNERSLTEVASAQSPA